MVRVWQAGHLSLKPWTNSARWACAMPCAVLYLSRVYSNLAPVLERSSSSSFPPTKNGVARCDVTTDGRFPIFGKPFSGIQWIRSLSFTEPMTMQVNGLVFVIDSRLSNCLKESGRSGQSRAQHQCSQGGHKCTWAAPTFFLCVDWTNEPTSRWLFIKWFKTHRVWRSIKSQFSLCYNTEPITAPCPVIGYLLQQPHPHPTRPKKKKK